MKEKTSVVGKSAEEKARLWLQSKGFRLLDKNVLIRGGEIDLVMEDGDFVVFVEVRRRSRADYGSAVESISFSKTWKVAKTALAYLARNGWSERLCRFDVVGIGPGEEDVEHIPNAFDAPSGVG